MRRLLLGSLATATVLALLVAGLLRGEPAKDTEPPRVAPLVRQLGDNEFAAREAATQELHEIGQAALPALQTAAARSEDAEIRWRAKQLVRLILMFSASTELELV